MERTTYNISAFNAHQTNRLKGLITLDIKEQREILKCVAELKDMFENNELGVEGKANIVLLRLNGIGSIIANK
mgnify:CR=1 FL=1